MMEFFFYVLEVGLLELDFLLELFSFVLEVLESFFFF